MKIRDKAPLNMDIMYTILNTSLIQDNIMNFNNVTSYCSAFIPRPNPTGFKWTDKMASELEKTYQKTDEVYAYCLGRKSEPLPVSVHYVDNCFPARDTRYWIPCPFLGGMQCAWSFASAIAKRTRSTCCRLTMKPRIPCLAHEMHFCLEAGTK